MAWAVGEGKWAMREACSFLDDLLPKGSHVSIKELAGAMGYHPASLRAAFEAGQLRGFALNARKVGEQGVRQSPRIPRPWALLFMLEHSSGLEDEELVEAVVSLASTLPLSFRRQLAKGVLG